MEFIKYEQLSLRVYISLHRTLEMRLVAVPKVKGSPKGKGLEEERHPAHQVEGWCRTPQHGAPGPSLGRQKPGPRSECSHC